MVNIMTQARNRDGTFVQGLIPADHYPTQAKSTEYLRSLNLETRYGREAFRALQEDARLAVNAARRFNERGGNPTTRPLNQLPCPENPGGRCTDRMEVTGFVELRDPVSGVSKRVPFVFGSDKQMSRSEIASAAARLALADVVARGYDAGGKIDPGTAVVGTVVIGSITGRG